MLGINEEPAYVGTMSDGGPQAPELHAVSEPATSELALPEAAVPEDAAPEDGAVIEPSLKLLDRQERLAEDVTVLVMALNQKLESYLALKGLLAAHESERADLDEALEWMQTTIEDLLATVVGIEATNVK